MIKTINNCNDFITSYVTIQVMSSFSYILTIVILESLFSIDSGSYDSIVFVQIHINQGSNNTTIVYQFEFYHKRMI